MKKYTYVPGAFIAVWLIWELVVRIGGFNEALLPTPYKVLLGFGELIGDGVLFKDIADSLVRFFIGYIISVVAGVFLGLILGWYKGIWNYINPIVQVIRPISPVAWLPFIVLFFGIGQAPAIVIIFIAAFFPVLLSTVSAIQNIDPVYIKVARNFGIKQPELLFKIVLPAVFPGIASGLHIALGTAWIFLVTGGNGRFPDGARIPHHRYAEQFAQRPFDGGDSDDWLCGTFTRLGRIPHRKMDL